MSDKIYTISDLEGNIPDLTTHACEFVYIGDYKKKPVYVFRIKSDE